MANFFLLVIRYMFKTDPSHSFFIWFIKLVSIYEYQNNWQQKKYCASRINVYKISMRTLQGMCSSSQRVPLVHMLNIHEHLSAWHDSSSVLNRSSVRCSMKTQVCTYDLWFFFPATLHATSAASERLLHWAVTLTNDQIPARGSSQKAGEKSEPSNWALPLLYCPQNALLLGLASAAMSRSPHAHWKQNKNLTPVSSLIYSVCF